MVLARRGLTSITVSQELERRADIWDRVSTLSSLASVVCGAVVFTLSLLGLRADLFFGDAGALEPLEEVAISGLFGMVTAVIFDKLASFCQLEGRRWRDKDAHLKIERIVRSSFNIEIVGDPDNSVSIVSRKIAGARTVKNTFVNLGGAPSALSSTEQAIRSAYVSFFEANQANRWHDIVSINEFYAFRHRHISPNATGKSQHQIHVLGVNTPIMNFIIIEPWDTNDVPEVYFGWLYGEVDGSRLIFKSGNPDIVGVFDDYFKILRDASEDSLSVDYSVPEGERERFELIKKSGYWLTVSYRDDVIHDYGIIRVHFKNNKPVVEGGIWDLKGDIRTIEHTDVVLYRDKIYFEYNQTSKGRKVKGFCIYNFVRMNGRDIIDGYYQDDGDEPRYKLAGFRLEQRKDYEEASAFLDAIDSKKREMSLLVPGVARAKAQPPRPRKRGAPANGKGPAADADGARSGDDVPAKD